MADTSYVTLQVDGQFTEEEAKQLCEQLDEQLGDGKFGTYIDHHAIIDSPDDVYRVDVSIEEARWGYEDDDLGIVTRYLRSLDIGWDAFDDGGCYWGASQRTWRPDMDEPATRTMADDQAVLTTSQWHVLRERLEVDDMGGRPWCEAVVEALDAHFGDDPKGWLE